MFDQLYVRPTFLARHRGAPMAQERINYLSHLFGQGSGWDSLRQTAAYLLVIAGRLELDEQAARSVTLEEIDLAAMRWARHRPKNKRWNPGHRSPKVFRSIAIRWLQFIGRLKIAEPVNRFEPLLAAFDEYMLKERGLSVVTQRSHRWFANRFLDQLGMSHNSLADLTINEVDAAFNALIQSSGYSRASIQTIAGHLRVFLRFAEARNWCRKGLAAIVKGPRVYSLDSLPAGPSWDDVKRLLALTEGDDVAAIRNRAILMLLAMYGLREGEVIRLRLEDFDWRAERLSVYSSKSRKTQILPLSQAVGDAVLRYLKKGRPHSKYREVFLSLRAPIQPLHGLWPIVALRLRRLGATTAHYGPHALRHACATHLLAKGLSLKQIGDHLGHRDPNTTRVYAKVDLVGLRKVADLDLGGLI
jgi:site-specific recombinase XerD